MTLLIYKVLVIFLNSLYCAIPFDLQSFMAADSRYVVMILIIVYLDIRFPNREQPASRYWLLHYHVFQLIDNNLLWKQRLALAP